MRRYFIYLVAFLAMMIFWTGSVGAQEWFRVKWVADGDTLFLQDGRHIRFIGINCPEVAHEDKPAEPFGETAKQTLKELVKQGRVRLEWDKEQNDHYGRKLAHVFDDKNRLLSQVMVAKGLAHVLFQKENQRYFELLLKSQQKAMAEKNGFWGAFQESTGDSAFAGNKRSLRFHRESCSEAKKIGRKNRIAFKNSWNAFTQGYAPAKECLKGIGTFIDSKAH